ncbi:MAG TPA: glycosyltransferase family 39 protein, partial [Candidatus Limnocylindria bacterium]|nr:glycosyltransferase family 39 protein [Candidatus Limnocylindria bacterium]
RASVYPFAPMAETDAQQPIRPRPPLLDRTDWLLITALTVVGMGLRLRYFSGYGLGDDIVLRNFIKILVSQGNVLQDNLAYRFTWWLPTAITCRLWGLREIPYLLPILIAATFSFPVVYAFGKALYGRTGALVAGLLFLACPLDFAWSTMLTPDLQASLFSGLSLFCVLRAAEQLLPYPRRRLLAWAALTSWLAFHSKLACAPMAVPILYSFWRHRRMLAGDLWAFFLPACVLFGGTVAVSYAFTGDVLAPYSSEISAQGLSGPVAVQFHRLTESVFWAYLRWLFYRNQYGDFFYSIYPHLLVVFVVVAPLLRLRLGAPEVWVWLLAVFLAMQFNIQYTEGTWVAGFRNVRHTHIFLYPMILLLAGYLVALARRWPRPAGALVAALVVFGLWQGRSLALKTHVSFEDRRRAATFLATLPKKTVYSDFQINTWRAILPGEEIRQPFKELPSFRPEERRAALAQVTEGYLVTGGGREPWYGCIDCIPREDEIPNKSHWRLIKEFPEEGRPITVWRPEPLKIWEYVGPGTAP